MTVYTRLYVPIKNSFHVVFIWELTPDSRGCYAGISPRSETVFKKVATVFTYNFFFFLHAFSSTLLECSRQEKQ